MTRSTKNPPSGKPSARPARPAHHHPLLRRGLASTPASSCDAAPPRIWPGPTARETAIYPRLGALLARIREAGKQGADMGAILDAIPGADLDEELDYALASGQVEEREDRRFYALPPRRTRQPGLRETDAQVIAIVGRSGAKGEMVKDVIKPWLQYGVDLAVAMGALRQFKEAHGWHERAGRIYAAEHAPRPAVTLAEITGSELREIELEVDAGHVPDPSRLAELRLIVARALATLPLSEAVIRARAEILDRALAKLSLPENVIDFAAYRARRRAS